MTELLLLIITALAASVAYFTKRIMDDTKKLHDEMKPIAPAIVEIQSKFTEAGHKLLFPLTVSPGSPLRLTDYGEKLVTESGFLKILANHHDMLVNAVKNKKPNSNYAIQEYSKEAIQDLLSNDTPELRPLRDYAYDNGMPLQVLVPPASISLRDEVMKELSFSDES